MIEFISNEIILSGCSSAISEGSFILFFIFDRLFNVRSAETSEDEMISYFYQRRCEDIWDSSTALMNLYVGCPDDAPNITMN